MKIVTSLKKILSKDFYPVLKKVMEKWPEASDIGALVKIAKEIETHGKKYGETLKEITERIGYDIGDRKSCDPDEITNFLLKEHGKFQPDGNLSIGGAPEEDKENFFRKKVEADAVMRRYSEAVNAILDEDYEIEIPRKITITEKHIRKETISAHECFLLEPILDLSKVSGEEDKKE